MYEFRHIVILRRGVGSAGFFVLAVRLCFPARVNHRFVPGQNMITGSYVLHLHCDRRDHDRLVPNHKEISEPTFSAGIRKGKQLGWYINGTRTVAICPHCVKRFK
jgi:hypothetical protein